MDHFAIHALKTLVVVDGASALDGLVGAVTAAALAQAAAFHPPSDPWPMMSIRSVNALSHYTDWTIAHVHSGALGWVGMSVFGMLYYMAPRVWERPLHSVSLATTHFWLASTGIVLYIVAMWTAGVTQGLMWRALDESGLLQYPNFVDTVKVLNPFYWIRFTGGTLYLVGVCVCAWNLYKTARSPAAPAVTENPEATAVVGA